MRKAGLLQLRIPWDLLNVTDPSTRTLLMTATTSGNFGTTGAVDFHVGVVLYRKGASRSGGELPAVEGRGLAGRGIYAVALERLDGAALP